jgi:CRISPR-associated protein Csh2
MWQAQGEKVVYIKSYKIEKNKLQPNDLNEQYTKVFGAKLDKSTPSVEVLKNLFSAIDVLNFGATFAEQGQNISITGAVQVGQGMNKYEDTNVETQDILSPFRNSSKEDADASSLGTKIVADEAHYFYSFSVNPNNYDDFLSLGIEDFEGYTVEAYEKFKAGCLIAATAYNTNSKSGCENEFAIFIKVKENSLLYLANLDIYIEFTKKDGKNYIDLTKLSQLLSGKMAEIEEIEVYYNSMDTEVGLAELICKTYPLY